MEIYSETLIKEERDTFFRDKSWRETVGLFFGAILKCIDNKVAFVHIKSLVMWITGNH